jgi:hypothetical protein
VGIIWARSAEKHGIPREDAVYAILNRLYYVQGFDPSRVGGVAPDLFIGPSRDGLQLLEVMIEPTPPRDGVVFHVMPARQKIIDIAKRKART